VEIKQTKIPTPTPNKTSILERYPINKKIKLIKNKNGISNLQVTPYRKTEDETES
jgi:hypothetical protein